MAYITFEEISKKTGYKAQPTVKSPQVQKVEPVVKVVQAPKVQPKVVVTNKPQPVVSAPAAMPAVQKPQESFLQQQGVSQDTFFPTTNPNKLAVPFQEVAKKNGLTVTGVDGTRPPVPTKEVPLPSDTPQSTAPSLLRTKTVELSQEEIAMNNMLERDGIIKSLIKAPIKDLIVVPGVRIAQVLTEIARPDVQAGQRDVSISLPALGKFDVQAQKTGMAGLKQIAGQGLTAASWLYAPEKVMNAGRTILSDMVIASVRAGEPVAASAVRKSLWNVVKQGTKDGSILGGMEGLGLSLQQDKGWDDNAKDFAIGMIFGGLAGGTLSGVGAGFSIAKNKVQFLQNQFEKELVSQGVSPLRAKQLATQGGFFGKFNPRAEELGHKINELNKRWVERPTIANKKALDAAKREYKMATQGGYVKNPFAPKEPVVPTPSVAQKERGAMKTVRTGKVTSPKLKTTIKDPENVGNRYYDVATDRVALEQATARIAQGVDTAHAFVKSGAYNKDVVATGVELIKKYDAEGHSEYAYDILEHLSKLATETGQGNQAWSLYNKLSPEGIVGFAKKQLDKAGVKMTPDLAEQLRKQAKKGGRVA